MFIRGDVMYQLFNIIKYRLLTVYKSKTMLGLTCLVVGLFALLISTLYKEAETSSKIAVAVVDLDQSPMTERIIDQLEKEEVLRVMVVTERDGKTMLKQDRVQAVYTMTEGFQTKINDEQYEGVYQVHYDQSNPVSRFIGDLFAEKVLRELCLVKSLSQFAKILDKHQIEDKNIRLEKAVEKGIAMQDYGDHAYYVNVQFIKDTKPINVNQVDNTLVYKKMILGMMLSFIAFYILFASIGIVKDKEEHIASRLRVTSTHTLTVVLGHYISLLLIGSLLSIIFGGISALYGESFYFITFVLILFVMSMSALVLLCAHLAHTVSNHMLILAIMILMMGIMSGSFFSIDVITSGLRYVTYLIPHVVTLDVLMNHLGGIHGQGLQIGYSWYYLLYVGILLGITCILNLYYSRKHS